MNVLDRIHQCGVIPVVQPPILPVAVELGAALAEAGLPCVEITFRAEGARRVPVVSGSVLVLGIILNLRAWRARRVAG